MTALQGNAQQIYAVEVNASINNLMTEGFLSPFSGYIYEDNRVRVKTEDGRFFVKGSKAPFDIIYSLSSNTFAALSSGAFALAENYLFTIEAFEDYYDALSENGFLVMEHQFYMPRLVSEALIALKRKGIEKPEEHLVVYDLPHLHRNVLLLGKRPISEDVRKNALGSLKTTDSQYLKILYPPGNEESPGKISRIVTEGWASVQPESAINLSPCSDDKPFTAQMGRWSSLDKSKLQGISPPGFLMGMPFPKAACRVGDLVDWGFAVNGVASVFGATAILLIAMTWGYKTSLIFSGVCYCLAWFILRKKLAMSNRVTECHR